LHLDLVEQPDQTRVFQHLASSSGGEREWRADVPPEDTAGR
jgi:hypothetical protein